MKQNAKNWKALYNENYAPPDWSLEEVGTVEWIERAKQCRVYFMENEAPANVEIVLSEREPVNIGMQPFYKGSKLETGYERLFKNGKLPPNLALYMPAHYQHHVTNKNKMHVINACGFAFDSKDQVDYKYFKFAEPNDKTNEFQIRLTNVFNLVFKCAIDLKIDHVVLCYLGGKAFSTFFRNPVQLVHYNPEYVAFFIKAVLDAFTETVKHSEITRISLSGTTDPGFPPAIGTKLNATFQEKGVAFTQLERIPKILNEDSLFVNAWDPHATVGNGNARDNSLDGYFGRLSDMGYMSMPTINPYLLNKLYPVQMPTNSQLHVTVVTDNLQRQLKQAAGENKTVQLIKYKFEQPGVYVKVELSLSASNHLSAQYQVDVTKTQFSYISQTGRGGNNTPTSTSTHTDTFTSAATDENLNRIINYSLAKIAPDFFDEAFEDVGNLDQRLLQNLNTVAEVPEAGSSLDSAQIAHGSPYASARSTDPEEGVDAAHSLDSVSSPEVPAVVVSADAEVGEVEVEAKPGEPKVEEKHEGEAEESAKAPAVAEFAVRAEESAVEEVPAVAEEKPEAGASVKSEEPTEAPASGADSSGLASSSPSGLVEPNPEGELKAESKREAKTGAPKVEEKHNAPAVAEVKVADRAEEKLEGEAESKGEAKTDEHKVDEPEEYEDADIWEDVEEDDKESKEPASGTSASDSLSSSDLTKRDDAHDADFVDSDLTGSTKAESKGEATKEHKIDALSEDADAIVVSADAEVGKVEAKAEDQSAKDGERVDEATKAGEEVEVEAKAEDLSANDGERVDEAVKTENQLALRPDSNQLALNNQLNKLALNNQLALIPKTPVAQDPLKPESSAVNDLAALVTASLLDNHVPVGGILYDPSTKKFSQQLAKVDPSQLFQTFQTFNILSKKQEIFSKKTVGGTRRTAPPPVQNRTLRTHLFRSLLS